METADHHLSVFGPEILLVNNRSDTVYMCKEGVDEMNLIILRSDLITTFDIFVFHNA